MTVDVMIWSSFMLQNLQREDPVKGYHFIDMFLATDKTSKTVDMFALTEKMAKKRGYVLFTV
mgnify:CR=1 FL=1